MHPSSPASEAPVILAKGISVTRRGEEILNNLDLLVEPGEIIAIQGPSGAGKSTLLGVLSGLIPPDSGSLWVGSSRMDGQPDRLRSAIRLRALGLVFQGDELLPELSLAENVTLPLRLTGRRENAAQYLETVRPLLSSLGIEALMDRRPSEVSGGQLQRAAIARAIVHDPSVILADEPTASLDPSNARSTLELLISLARRKKSAVVVVTHDNDLASHCDRRLALHDGRLVDPVAGRYSP